jgi:hypothetical protein
MAYKFQLGTTVLSGSTTFEEDLTSQGQVQGNTVVSKGIVSGSGDGRFLALDIDGTEVITSARQLSNIATLDATTESTIEDAIDTLANLTSAGTSGADLTIAGPLDIEEGLKQNGTEILSDAGALSGLTTISGSGTLTVGAVSTDGAVTGGSLTDGTATLSAGALAGATTISGSGNISGGGLEIGGGTIINNLAGSGLTVSGNSLTVSAYTVTQITDGGDLTAGINFMTASANGVSVTVPTGSGLTNGDTFRVKTRMAEGDTFTITRTGTDVIDAIETSITLESPGAAVDLVYVGLGNFIIL